MLLALCVAVARAEPATRTRNLILVTIDGLRWQEVFAGADPGLPSQADPTHVAGHRRPGDPLEERRQLMPFLWTVVARDGQLYGNAGAGNRFRVSNAYGLSYPGYNELLTGAADDERIRSNAPIANPNTTLLEVLNQQPGLRDRVAAFASWDRFPWILNEERSGLPVNAGFRQAGGADLSLRERWLNQLTRRVRRPWRHSRQDSVTHAYALAYLQHRQPRIAYIAYGDTDEYAHEGQYHAYLAAAHRTDGFLRELWQWLQSQPAYRDQTTLLVTTDHGRGSAAAWRTHGRDIAGSADGWLAIIGPDTAPGGEMRAQTTHYLAQVASTAAALLGYPGWPETTASPPIASALPHGPP